jgi:hypothetical protein
MLYLSNIMLFITNIFVKLTRIKKSLLEALLIKLPRIDPLLGMIPKRINIQTAITNPI